MELPRERRERDSLYRNLIRTCEYSRTDRRERFRQMRTLYLTGSETAQRARMNTLKEWASLSTSLVYASENLQFGVMAPPYYGAEWDEELVLAREELHRLWFDGTSAGVAQEAVTQAHYADTAIAKLFVSQNQVQFDVLSDPSDIGVIDEHLRWDQQEAITHWYTLSLPAFWRMLQAYPDATQREKIWRTAVDNAMPSSEARGDVLPPTVQRIILASASPTMVGNVQSTTNTVLALPRSRDPVVSLAELWIWDDRAGELCAGCRERKSAWRHSWPAPTGHAFDPSGDYVPDWRVVTNFLATEDILWDPVNPLGIDGHAFFPLCLEPMPGYTWGVAPMEHLIGLQLWRERKLGELDLRDELQTNPPLALYGVPFQDGERTKTYRKPGGDIPLTNPNSKVEPIVPPPLADPFLFVDKIDGMRAQMAGIPRGMAGQTEPGVRSGEQAVAQALLGAGPTLSRAMVVEDWLESLATAMLRLHRNILDRPLVKASGEKVLLRQMPGDLVARVWAHSASPVYTEHLTQKALVAHKEKLIGSEDALAFLNLPGTDMLLRRAKKLEQAQAERGEKIVSLKEREVAAKERKAEK